MYTTYFSCSLIYFFFLFLALIFSVGLISCDSDNLMVPDSEAQEPVPDEEEVEVSCPCFTAEDVETAGNNSNDVECGVAVFGMALLPDNSPALSLTVECMNDGTACQCSNGVSNMDITQDEFKACMSNMVTGLIRYNDQDLKTVGCE